MASRGGSNVPEYFYPHWNVIVKRVPSAVA
jgi:hypothetical protein